MFERGSSKRRFSSPLFVTKSKPSVFMSSRPTGITRSDPMLPFEATDVEFWNASMTVGRFSGSFAVQITDSGL